MKVYIASPFFNPAQLAVVTRLELVLEAMGIMYFSPRSGGTLKDMSKDEMANRKKAIFDDNIAQMDSCTHMIACIEHRDTGTSFEIGYYYAKGKPVCLFADDIGQVNVMLAECASSVYTDLRYTKASLEGRHSEEVGDLT